MKTVTAKTVPDLLAYLREGNCILKVDAKLKNHCIMFHWGQSEGAHNPNGERLSIGSNIKADLKGISFYGSQVQILNQENVHLKNFRAQSGTAWLNQTEWISRDTGGGVRSLHIGESANIKIERADCGFADDENLDVIYSEDVTIDHCISDNGRVLGDPLQMPATWGYLYGKAFLTYGVKNLTVSNCIFRNCTSRYPDMTGMQNLVFEKNMIFMHQFSGCNWGGPLDGSPEFDRTITGRVTSNRWYNIDPAITSSSYVQPIINPAYEKKIQCTFKGNTIDDKPAGLKELMAPRARP